MLSLAETSTTDWLYSNGRKWFMKYKGVYWSLFAPMIRNSIAERYSKELADRSIKRGKKEYRKLLAHADELGPGNPMASNAYFAYVFAAAWLGSGREITPEDMGQVMTDVLEGPLLKKVFGMTDLNRDPKKWYRDMKKYDRWFRRHGDRYPVNWNVSFDESLHSEGSYYYFTRCPICEFCEREGISELMPALCATDEVMFRLQHGKLHREHTIAGGDDICDYWVTGDGSSGSKGMFWDRVAGVYDIFTELINAKVHRRLKQVVALQISSDDEVLECACGTGMLTEVVAPLCKSITATDFSPKMIKQTEKKCRGYSNVTVRNADILALDFPDERFDVVIAANVIHLLDEPLKALGELDRVCRNDGKLIIPTYMNKDSKGKTSGFASTVGKAGADFKRQFTFGSYQEFFADAGDTDAEYTMIEGRVPCAVAVLRKQ